MRTESRSPWNHAPQLPIRNSPVFAWPPRPRSAFRHLVHRWIDLSANALFLALSILVIRFGLPDPATMETLGMSWIARIWLINVGLTLLVAGGLHLLLVYFAVQGKRLKFHDRQMGRGNKSFTFRDQVLDNMFWTFAGGVTAWTVFQVLYLWAAANAWIPALALPEAPVWFVVTLLLVPAWSSMHFYWVHRFLHWPPVYSRIHSLHHRNINIGPWSGLSMHPVECFIYVSAVLIHFVVPTHLLVFMTHLLAKCLGPAFSHSGFEKLLTGPDEGVNAGDFHHQLHHRYFECNYGTTEMPWDAWFGTFHDGTEDATRRVKDRQRRRAAP